jgi:hypothetical protein
MNKFKKLLNGMLDNSKETIKEKEIRLERFKNRIEVLEKKLIELQKNPELNKNSIKIIIDHIDELRRRLK